MTKTKTCDICNGVGYLPVPNDPDTRIKCKCTLIRLYRNKLGNDVFNATNLKRSAYSDRVDKNVFVTANRHDFLPHLRYTLIDHGLNFFSRVTNDSQMLDAWLSKEMTHSQSEGTASHVDYTSLRDLVENPQLLIIFLCVVSYTNRALPGILLEAMRIRNFVGKPTWIINPHTHPFNQGHLCWSAEVEEFIVGNYMQKKIKPSVKTSPLSKGITMRDTEALDAGGNRVTRAKPDFDIKNFM